MLEGSIIIITIVLYIFIIYKIINFLVNKLMKKHLKLINQWALRKSYCVVNVKFNHFNFYHLLLSGQIYCYNISAKDEHGNMIRANAYYSGGFFGLISDYSKIIEYEETSTP